MSQKKTSKTAAEKAAENLFPLDTSDIKHTVEKQYKRIPSSEIETVETSKSPKKSHKTRKSRKKTTKKKSAKKTTKKPEKKEFKAPKIKLKQEGYELIITEKPQAALKIASALGNSRKLNINKIPYYEVDRDGQKIVVGCAVGHLFTLAQNVNGSTVPIFDISWTPNYMVRKKDFSKKYYEVMKKLAKEAGSITIATDYDIEGEVIGLNVMRFVCGQKDASRMKFSTLTNRELNNAYDDKKPSINWGQAIAGETRHYLDWFYGINLSRALMNAIKTTGKFKIMSIGRVQGPTLNLIVQKEREIQAFVPKTYWQIFITVINTEGDIKLELKHNKDIFDKKGLDAFKDLVGKKAQAQTKKTQQIIPPHPPFNLTTLQTEAYKFYGITPSRTLQIAQSLYLAGLISYPRTSSQKLPSSIGYKDILKKLAKEYKVEHLMTKNKPVEGAKSDPAHPSIYPTGEKQILSDQDEKIYNLIVKRFLSLFCDDAIIDNKTIRATVDKLIFSTRGSSILKKAWMEIYPIKLKEVEVPDLEGEIEITDSRIEEKQTQPPKRYSPASILSELEKRNLGTKATRANILETLYDRNYIKEKSIQATPLGMSLIKSLETYSPIIIDEALTRDFETEMESILEATSGYIEKEEKIINKAKAAITDISKQFEKNEKKIGSNLVEANLKFREQEKEANKLVLCPKCKKGQLAITYSPKTRRHFIACNAYPECKNTFSLPPNSKISKTNKICEECNFPMLMSIRYGKRPWIFCFNPECPKNKERIDAYNKKKAEEVEDNNI